VWALRNRVTAASERGVPVRKTLRAAGDEAMT
jgi:hypothetical protein